MRYLLTVAVLRAAVFLVLAAAVFFGVLFQKLKPELFLAVLTGAGGMNFAAAHASRQRQPLPDRQRIGGLQMIDPA